MKTQKFHAVRFLSFLTKLGLGMILLGLPTWVFASSGVSIHLEKDGYLYFSVHHPGLLNATAKKDLTSGLATQAVILAQLTSNSEVVMEEKLYVVSSKYDLWEEMYYLNMAGSPETVRDRNKVETILENPGPFKLISGAVLQKSVVYRLKSIETINPIDREKFESLQRWVIDQKSFFRSLGGGADSVSAPAMPENAFRSLFYSLWIKSKAGESLAGEMRREIESEPFTLESLTVQEGVKK